MIYAMSDLTKEIVLLFDADVAGQKATEKVINLFKGSELSVCVVELPNTKDPDEFIKKNGAEAFKALLDSAMCDIEYKLLSAEKEIEINSDTSKLKYLTEQYKKARVRRFTACLTLAFFSLLFFLHQGIFPSA